jgi:ketosteroid isomerase-like protein
MQRHIALAFLILVSAGLTRQQASKNEAPSQRSPSGVRNEIEKSIRGRLAALRRGDARTYLTYFAEDCFVTGDNGALIRPEGISNEWIDTTAAGVSYQGSEPLDLQVHAYVDIAVASFRLELDEDWAGQRLFGTSRFTDVFTRRGDRWMLVAHQETPVPNARRVAVNVDPAGFDAYSGEYQITPGYRIKVKREGDKLMEQWPSDPDYIEDVPVSESTFVARGEPGLSIYVKGKTGKVTNFISRTPSGDLIAKKIR